MVSLTQNLNDGRGILTPDEAAFYARIPRVTMRRWLEGNTQGRGIIKANSDQNESVTFLDFVQALAIRAIRSRFKISLQKIRAAVELAESKGVASIFAREHTTFWDGKDIHILEGENYTQLTGKHPNQQSWKQLVELYMRDLTFGKDGLACHYRAFVWGDRKIEMDPALRFGEPIVTSCGYTARALWEACEAEGNVEAAAEAYGVTVEDAECAIRYYDHLKTAA